MPAAAESLSGTAGLPHPAQELAIEPTLEQVRALVASAVGDGAACELIPLRHSFIADCETPVSAFLKLRALAPSEPAFLLESADQGQRVGRWSFIGVRPRSVLRWSLGDPGDPYALAAELVAGFHQMPLAGCDSSRGAGGGVAMVGGAQANEAPFHRRRCGLLRLRPGAHGRAAGAPPARRVGPTDPMGLPDMALMLSDVLVIFDHLKHTVTILANVEVDAGMEHTDAAIDRRYADAAQTIAEIRQALDGSVPHRESEPTHPKPAHPRETPRFESNMSRARFEGMVERIVRYIHAGDAFQVVPSQRWSAAGAGRGLLDLPGPARGQPLAVHVLPGLRRLPGRGCQPRAAAHG